MHRCQMLYIEYKKLNITVCLGPDVNYTVPKVVKTLTEEHANACDRLMVSGNHIYRLLFYKTGSVKDNDNVYVK